MPDIPIKVPPFLVSAAEQRPGYSSLGAFEKLVGKLQKLGIPTGDMPDGSPNLMLPSQLAGIQSQDEESTDNKKITSVIMNGQGTSAFGPVIINPFTVSHGIEE